MPRRKSLRGRILAWLGAFTLLITAAVFLHGYLVNERAEQLVWDSLLRTLFDQHVERAQGDPNYRWRDTSDMRLFVANDGRPKPREIDGLPPGVHDEVGFDGREWVLYVADVDGVRHTLALDITDFEAEEMALSLYVLSWSLGLVLFIGLLAAWGIRRFLQPLADMAGDIERLDPHRAGQRIAGHADGSSELQVIAGALNGYLARNEQFVERERMFIDTASHELRTPIAVIAGATELALAQPGLTPAARNQVARAHRTAREVEELVSLLLVLAKDPGRLARSSDRVALDELIPGIVDNHGYLSRDKALSLVVAPLPHCEIVAPLAIVQAAIGNLLRNAIENSDRGEIRVSLSPDAVVTIEDPGHGMSPEEISRVYAQVARGGGRAGGGIGLDLLGRLCEHLGWKLDLRSAPGKGTVSTLAFAPVA